ncbi:MAG: hypothetical protein ACQESR_26210, partial [Planctomycetota bacterium]
MACSRAAYRHGIRPRMSLAEAVALQETGMAAEFAPPSSRGRSQGGTVRTTVSLHRHASHGAGAGNHSSASSISGERDGQSGAGSVLAKPDDWGSDSYAPYIAEHHPQADAEQLERLAEWCECFSP